MTKISFVVSLLSLDSCWWLVVLEHPSRTRLSLAYVLVTEYGGRWAKEGAEHACMVRKAPGFRNGRVVYRLSEQGQRGEESSTVLW